MVRSGTALAGFWNVGSECKADKAAHRKLVVADVDLWCQLSPHKVTPQSPSPVEIRIAEKIRKVFEAANPPNGPMMNFDETDLLYMAEAAGFTDVNVILELSSTEHAPYAGARWDDLMKVSPNPNAPTYGEAIHQVLTYDETSRLEEHLRPLIDDNAAARQRTALAYVTACRT